MLFNRILTLHWNELNVGLEAAKEIPTELGGAVNLFLLSLLEGI